MIMLDADWYTLVALVAVSCGEPVPTDHHGQWILWERTCFPFGTPAQVAAQVVQHYRT